MTNSSDSGQISVDPGATHKVDGFALSPEPARSKNPPDSDKSPGKTGKKQDNPDIDAEKAEWEGEGGSPPDSISSVDEDGDPPRRPA